MSDRDTYRSEAYRHEQDRFARQERDWRDRPNDRYRDQERSFRDSDRYQGGTDQRGAGYGYGYGDGGSSSYGQMAQGSSDRVEGGYGGANVGGFGQSGLNSQWGQGGYGPMTQGSNYSQGGDRFGPAGYGEPGYGSQAGAHHHDHSYRRWRDAQLDTHDRDYARWRAEQARRYDEDYSGWRDNRHAAFTQEFEGWRANRGGATATTDPTTASFAGTGAHGANRALADVADGGVGRGTHDAERENKTLEQQAKRNDHQH